MRLNTLLTPLTSPVDRLKRFGEVKVTEYLNTNFTPKILEASGQKLEENPADHLLQGGKNPWVEGLEFPWSWKSRKKIRRGGKSFGRANLNFNFHLFLAKYPIWSLILILAVIILVSVGTVWFVIMTYLTLWRMILILSLGTQVTTVRSETTTTSEYDVLGYSEKSFRNITVSDKGKLDGTDTTMEDGLSFSATTEQGVVPLDHELGHVDEGASNKSSRPEVKRTLIKDDDAARRGTTTHPNQSNPETSVLMTRKRKGAPSQKYSAATYLEFGLQVPSDDWESRISCRENPLELEGTVIKEHSCESRGRKSSYTSVVVNNLCSESGLSMLKHYAKSVGAMQIVGNFDCVDDNVLAKLVEIEFPVLRWLLMRVPLFCYDALYSMLVGLKAPRLKCVKIDELQIINERMAELGKFLASFKIESIVINVKSVMERGSQDWFAGKALEGLKHVQLFFLNENKSYNETTQAEAVTNLVNSFANASAELNFIDVYEQAPISACGIKNISNQLSKRARNDLRNFQVVLKPDSWEVIDLRFLRKSVGQHVEVNVISDLALGDSKRRTTLVFPDKLNSRLETLVVKVYNTNIVDFSSEVDCKTWYSNRTPEYTLYSCNFK